ncbi:hypothetical protein [Carboxylicivirga marina]|uniref:YcxB-like protein domain-containing protein n=1 Tax=Carboxylicivirga marina TaxID=2800988 RepID=A0ABS1HQY3_9BACT|nr:hypothetical protein [Carboxylicivirga marina]MBK3519900.1 hypothetical protein [Carboxylicivirga marina]
MTTQRKKIIGINNYERQVFNAELIKLSVTIVVFIVIAFMAAVADRFNLYLATIAIILLSATIYYTNRSIASYKRMQLIFDYSGVVFNGKHMRYQDLKTASAYFIHVRQDRSSRYATWTEDYYYRCFSLRFKLKDIMIGYIFETYGEVPTAKDYRNEIEEKINGRCETYHNDTPYIFIFTEDDFALIYSKIKKLNLEIIHT